MIQSEQEQELNIRPLGFFMATFFAAVITSVGFFIYISVGQNTIENTQKRIDLNKQMLTKIDSIKNVRAKKQADEQNNYVHGKALQ